MSALSNRYYTQESLFTKEKEDVFFKSWLFVCTQDEVAKNNDFFTINYFGIPVVVQNFHGKLKAFLNICTHRLNTIQTEQYGNRPLICEYHYWSFDEQGNPRIPKTQEYEDLECVKNERKLKQFNLDVCGKFVFVNISNDAAPLKVFLGPFYEHLEMLSELMDKQFDRRENIQMANWKLIVENVLECLHCSCLHKTTFAKVGYGDLPSCTNIKYDGHSMAEYPKNLAKAAVLEQDGKRLKLLSYLNTRKKHSTGYFHYYIFPNLLIGSVEYSNVYIGLINPVTPNETTFTARNYDVHIEDDSVKQKAVHEFFMTGVIDNNRLTLEEDRVVVERIQKNMLIAGYDQIIGSEEFRIKDFHNYYNALMKTSTAEVRVS
jgi:phenylpropionate dioxygenase-like ring-hydroxylating dioxygenase large terminal subunit